MNIFYNSRMWIKILQIDCNYALQIHVYMYMMEPLETATHIFLQKNTHRRLPSKKLPFKVKYFHIRKSFKKLPLKNKHFHVK